LFFLNVVSPAFTDPPSAGAPAIETRRSKTRPWRWRRGSTANVTFRVFDPDKNDAVKFDTFGRR
jgi:hypothetical protein